MLSPSPAQLAPQLPPQPLALSGFETEALPWIKDVYRYALSLTKEPADAEDVVQETYLRAQRSWHTFEPGSDCRRWLFTICRNAFLRSHAHPSAIMSRHADDLDGALNVPAADWAACDDRFSGVDVAPAIGRALADLPEPFQAAVRIVDVDDQSYEVAAGLLGVPIGTVRSRLFRGRRLMQERLWAFARDAGLAGGQRLANGLGQNVAAEAS
jgi:RNA polymerase sigma-70 factor, ECF subfamily